jgi:hypothetical protein
MEQKWSRRIRRSTKDRGALCGLDRHRSNIGGNLPNDLFRVKVSTLSKSTTYKTPMAI